MKTAFIFPGQGAQSLGMLADAGTEWPIVRQTFNEASDVLGFDLWDICQRGPEEELNSTAVTQPALLTASVALWRQWLLDGGAKPDYVAGHSLGEYSALVAAESLRFLDAVRLVRLRGELMQSAVPRNEGRMAAIIGLDDDAVREACAAAAEGEVVEAVNFNAPGQVVIAGHTEAVRRALELAKEKGARKVVTLAVSVPSHCALMREAAKELAEDLQSVSMDSAVIPVVQNVTATVETDRAVLIENLVKQLYSPVLWTDVVRQLASLGVTSVVECGPGRVLSGLVKRIDRSLALHSLESVDDYSAAMAALKADT
ncbi:ACP S-malonyltransferase [Mangrovitalea sediminis]|uniref:ACP S-malonyltransferase n=1 Tax=Mangrovitalea sediminis TaxID=1982043 RepID=UPI000BE61AB7|nr:ACP S-malonyltransferase [Mangrovitalea sediminis]